MDQFIVDNYIPVLLLVVLLIALSAWFLRLGSFFWSRWAERSEKNPHESEPMGLPDGTVETLLVFLPALIFFKLSFSDADIVILPIQIAIIIAITAGWLLWTIRILIFFLTRWTRRSEPNPNEANSWARMVAGGFVEDTDPPRHIVDLVASGFQIGGATCHAAESDGQLAGGGTVLVDRGVAALVGQSTAPHLRKKGVQGALIRAGLATAVKAGCDLASTCTLPGSMSQRNFERQGFRVVYTRSKMRRDWDR